MSTTPVLTPKRSGKSAIRSNVLAKEAVSGTVYAWEGKDKQNKRISGEMRATSPTLVSVNLRKQGIRVEKIKKKSFRGGRKIKEKDIALVTRQLATMMKSGVPLLQSFDIIGKGHANPKVSRLMNDIRSDIETGVSLSDAFRKFPLYFDQLYCNLIYAGEQAGILESLLDRLAVYKEKSIAIKGKIKSALVYPISILVVAFVVTAVIMIWVVPSFKEVFSSFGADLPVPTLMVIKFSDLFVANWIFIFGGLFLFLFLFLQTWRRSEKMQHLIDRLLLRLPIFGETLRKAVIARWTRTLSTMFASGVPLADSLDSVGRASGNFVYADATKKIQKEVMTGISLTVAMENAGIQVFPNMVTQMVSIGEESGSLDDMLGKVADFYEQEVDDAVASLSSLMEPLIMIVLGVLIGGLVIAMYLPIFKLGAVV